MGVIKSITNALIYNSHLEQTNEFQILLSDGSIGRGGSPMGETISIYEDKKTVIDANLIIDTIQKEGMMGMESNQEKWDRYLDEKIPFFGRNNAYALSLAFFNAHSSTKKPSDLFVEGQKDVSFPKICFNILNGGWHAYTNPVLSDFPEFLLVSKNNRYEELIAMYTEIMQVTRERLVKLDKVQVSGNPVNIFATRDNREVLDFLLDIRHQTGTTEQFDLMIDTSGTDLWDGSGYQLAITNQAVYDREQYLKYWLDMIKDYRLRFLEDPFYELDYENWYELTVSQDDCFVIGDNFYTTDVRKITQGVEKQYTHGVIIKPNQAGTVTGVRQALITAKKLGQIAITSHRSVSTESVFLSNLTCFEGAPYMKIGPLLTDYSSVIRLNEMIRILHNMKEEK